MFTVSSPLTALAFTVLYAILLALDFLLLNTCTSSKKLEEKSETSADTGITSEGLGFFYQQLHFRPVRAVTFLSLTQIAFRIAFITELV